MGVVLRWDPANAAFVHGIAGGTEGRYLVVENINAVSPILFVNDSGTEGTAGNRIWTPWTTGVMVGPRSVVLLWYDATAARWRVMGGHDVGGLQPMAHANGLAFNAVSGITSSLTANGGAMAIPIVLTAIMRLDSLTIWNTDTTLARTAEWRLYQERLGNVNTMDHASNGTAKGTWSFTAAAAAAQNSVATGAPVWLPPGQYWLVVRNTHASNTFGIGALAAGSLATNMRRNAPSTITALASTIDISTWTGQTSQALAVLRGRIGGEAAQF